MISALNILATALLCHLPIKRLWHGLLAGTVFTQDLCLLKLCVAVSASGEEIADRGCIAASQLQGLAADGDRDDPLAGRPGGVKGKAQAADLQEAAEGTGQTADGMLQYFLELEAAQLHFFQRIAKGENGHHGGDGGDPAHG